MACWEDIQRFASLNCELWSLRESERGLDGGVFVVILPAMPIQPRSTKLLYCTTFDGVDLEIAVRRG